MLTMRAVWFSLLCILIAGLSYAEPANLNQADPHHPIPPMSPNTPRKPARFGKPVQSLPPLIPSNINITVGGKLELASNREQAQAPEEQQERFSEFFNVKITDIVIALFTIVIGMFTFYLYKATAQLARISRQQEQAAQTMERAYVKMVECPPGLVFDEALHKISVNVKIRNFGRTPCRVTDVVVCLKQLPQGGSLPIPIDYKKASDHKAFKAFMVAEDECFTLRWFASMDSHKETLKIPEIRRGAVDLWLYGYVDYIDQFGKRHRGGFARFYKHNIDRRTLYKTEEDFDNRDNLLFITQNGNYDRPRKQDEGNDWGEKSQS